MRIGNTEKFLWLLFAEQSTMVIEIIQSTNIVSLEEEKEESIKESSGISTQNTQLHESDIRFECVYKLIVMCEIDILI